GPAVTGADHVDHVQPVLGDDAVQVGVDEVEPRRGAPVPQQPGLDVLDGEGPIEQRIVLEIDLADGGIVRGAPVGMHPVELLRTESAHLTLLGKGNLPGCSLILVATRPTAARRSPAAGYPGPSRS